MLCNAMLNFSSPRRSISLITQVQTVVGVIGSLEKHVERQQSENRQATASASVNEEELNVEESSAGGDDLVQPNNDVTGDDGNVSPVLAAAIPAIPTSEVVGGKKRSRETASSVERIYPRNAMLQTRSKKRSKRSHSTLHETPEVVGTTAQTPVVRRSSRSATTNKAREGTFEGARAGSEVPVSEETDGDFMPVDDEDGPPLNDRDADHDEDGNDSMLEKCAQQDRSAFDQRFTDLMGFKQKFGHFDVTKKTTDEYQSLGQWCNNLRRLYKKIKNRETTGRKLTKEMIQQLDDAGFKWSMSSTFDERFAELMKFKEKFGHCNAPRKKSSEYQSLGKWCSTLREPYKKIQKNETPPNKLTQENIRQLEDAGFKWSVSRSRTFS